MDQLTSNLIQTYQSFELQGIWSAIAASFSRRIPKTHTYKTSALTGLHNDGGWLKAR